MTMPADSSITSWVAKVCHAASKAPCITELNKVMVLTAGLPAAYTSLMPVVYISTVLSNKLDFEDIVTHLLNEEQCQKPTMAVSTLSWSLSCTNISDASSPDNIAAAVMSSQNLGSRAGFASHATARN
jgi:hypothetical protein